MTDAPRPPPPPPVPGTAPAAKRGASTGQKVLIGCLSAFVVVSVIAGVLMWWGARKFGEFAKQAGKNPAAFAAKMIVAANPDLEIVSEDEGSQTVTIRNKKTGETLTMNAEELKQGKLAFENRKGEKITFDGSKAEGEGAITVTTDEGTTVVGGGTAANLPAWVPAFPGAKPKGAYSQAAGKAEEGTLAFETDEPAAKVLDFYQAQLQARGYVIERSATGAEGGGAGILTASSKAEHREVNVVAISNDGGTGAQVNVRYESKPE